MFYIFMFIVLFLRDKRIKDKISDLNFIHFIPIFIFLEGQLYLFWNKIILHKYYYFIKGKQQNSAFKQLYSTVESGR